MKARKRRPAADKISSMVCAPVLQHATSTSAQCAVAILQAWIAGDTRKVRDELDHSLVLAEPVERRNHDEERLELLGAVSRRLIDCIDDARWSDTDPQVSLCVSLLAHLASRQDGD